MQAKFSLEHIGLAAQDTTALKDWYVRSLGARVIFTNAEQPPAYIIELSGGVWVEIYQGNYAVKKSSDSVPSCVLAEVTSQLVGLGSPVQLVDARVVQDRLAVDGILKSFDLRLQTLYARQEDLQPAL